MDGKGPPKTAVILATPVNVEESRAQRLQRQQSRFRDRGGIFVPSSRSTLANILLGKASPLKKFRGRSRSASVSPCKAKSHIETGTETPKEFNRSKLKSISRKSPQKQSRKSTQPTEVENNHVENKPKSRKSAGTTKKSKPSVEDSPKPPPAKKAASRKASRATASTEASTSKRKTKKSEQVDGDAGLDQDGSTQVIPKAKPKGKVVNSSKPLASKMPATKEPKSIPKQALPQTSHSTSSAVAGNHKNSTRSRPRKSSDLYSGESEDEYVPRQPIRPKKTTVKANQPDPPKEIASTSSKGVPKPVPPAKGKKKENTQLPDIAEEEDDEEEEQVYKTVITTKSSVVQPSTTKTDKKGKKRLSPEVNSDPEEVPKPPKKRLKKSEKATLDVLEPEPEPEPKPRAKSKAQKKAIKKPPQEPEPEEDTNEKDLEPATKRKNVGSGTKSKAPAKSTNKPPPKQDVEEEIAAKRPMNKKKTEESETNATKKLTKKRSRNQDPEESSVEEPPKRKKVADGPKASQAKAKASQPKNSAAKSIPKTSSANETKRPTAKATKSAKRDSAQAPSKTQRGPPKSVLQRIHNSQPDEIDYEPDPIDFLS